MKLGKWLDKVRDEGPVRYLVLFVLTQTLAAAFAAEVISRWFDGAWAIGSICLAAAAVLAVLALRSWAMRGDARRRGTALSLVVARGGEAWQQQEAIRNAKGLAQRENFRHFYPLVSPPAQMDSTDGVLDWSEVINFHGTILRSIFDEEWGFDFDRGEWVQLSLATPLPVAFELGRRWVDLTKDHASKVRLVSIPITANDGDPTVLWRSDGRDHLRPLRTTEADPSSAQVVVFHLQARELQHDVLDQQFPGGWVSVGERAQLKNEDPLIEQHIALLRETLSRISEGAQAGVRRTVKLVLVTPAPVAFAVGWRLRNLRIDIRLLEYSRTIGKYLEVEFGERRTE